MTLYLVQHGQCFDKQTDPERSLTPEGRASILQVAITASDAGITVSSIYHSGKLRALQTAKIFSEQISVNQIESIAGLEPLDSVENFANHFEFLENSMIIGHLPFMERLTSFLITGNQQLTVVKFQNAGIVCLEQNENNNWHIKSTIMPVID
jgi:phosphohistidine phosphatase